MPRAKDLTGMRFGELTAVKPTDKRDSGSIVWECACDCGQTCDVSARNLVNGHTKSCGHLVGRSVEEGEVFGALTAVERVGSNDAGRALWRCACECGKETIIKGAELRAGSYTSCGCGAEHYRRVSETLGRVEGTCLDALTRGLQKNNKSGVRGVFWNKRRGKWTAAIKFKGKLHQLGCFETLEEAAEARRLAEVELYDPVLKRHGKSVTQAKQAPDPQ